MPDYLARVAAAAARTTTAARPHVAAPPLLPAAGLASTAQPPASMPADTWGTVRESTSESRVPAGAGVTAEAGAGASSAQVARQPAPPGEPLPSADRAAPLPLSPAPMRDARPGLPGLAAAVETRLAGPQQATPIIKAPRSLRPAPKLNQPAPPGGQEAQVLPAQLPALRVSARTDAPALRPNERAEAQQPPGRLAVPTTSRPASAAPLSPALASIPEPPAGGGGKRQSKITIGQIDVQVHNRPPAPVNARPTPTAGPIPSDALEQRYLDRFRLKP